MSLIGTPTGKLCLRAPRGDRRNLALRRHSFGVSPPTRDRILKGHAGHVQLVSKHKRVQCRVQTNISRAGARAARAARGLAARAAREAREVRAAGEGQGGHAAKAPRAFRATRAASKGGQGGQCGGQGRGEGGVQGNKGQGRAQRANAGGCTFDFSMKKMSLGLSASKGLRNRMGLRRRASVRFTRADATLA